MNPGIHRSRGRPPGHAASTPHDGNPHYREPRQPAVRRPGRASWSSGWLAERQRAEDRVTLALRVSGESGGYWLARSQVGEFGFVAQPQAGGQPGTLVEFNERGNSQRTVASLLVHHSPAHEPAEAAGAGPAQRGVLAAARAAACAWGQPPGAAVTALDHQLAAGGTGQEFGASRVRPHHADALDAARLTRQCVGTGR